MVNSPTASLPFPIKLGISIFLDFLGISLKIFEVISGFLSVPVSAIYGVFYALVYYLLFSSYLGFALFGAVFSVAKFSIPSVFPWFNAFPVMTLSCLWNGYKTGWRY